MTALLPASASVIKTDISDHFLVAYHNKSIINNYKNKYRQFNAQNNLKFTNLLTNTRWGNINTITDPNKAFNYFENKLKKYNKAFPIKEKLNVKFKNS